MTPAWPRALGGSLGKAILRRSPEDFEVRERLGFELSGDGEHVFLQLQKTQLNTRDLVQRVARLSAVPERDVGYSGLKDRNALTSQWLQRGHLCFEFGTFRPDQLLTSTTRTLPPEAVEIPSSPEAWASSRAC